MTIRRTKRAAVAGALSVDICPQFLCGEKTSYGEVIVPGEITQIAGQEIHPGGPVANTGIALRIFGIEPYLYAKVGTDDFGRMLKNMLDRSAGEYATDCIITDPGTYTAYSVILAVPGLDRAILQNPGANDAFRQDDVKFGKLQDCALFHFGHPSTMKQMYENGGDGLCTLMARARVAGMLTSLDLCAIDPESDAARENWYEILSRVLPLTDFFLPSIDELGAILTPGRDQYDEKELAEKCMALGAQNVLIKCGERGMYYRNAGEHFYAYAEQILELPYGSLQTWSGRLGFRKAVPADTVVSGLGAGDTSIAAYLAALLQGLPFDRALELAVTEGSLCVTQASATGGLVPFDEI